MNLALKGFSQLIEDMSAALQGSATNLIDVSVGSVIRAIFEANASVVLWLQWLVLQVLQTTRAATSVGADLDSWMMDFNFIRLPAVASAGTVTFSRFSASTTATIPVGAMIKTADGLVSFSVVEDPTLSIWQASSSSYILPVGVSSAELPATCAVVGTSGNILAGAITVIATPVPGVDQVINSNPFVFGADAESDQALRIRFQNYLSSLSRATPVAILSAVSNVRQGLDVDLLENTAADGSQKMGSFLVIVDDGTGEPSSDLLSTIATAVDLVRPVGTMFAVIGPTVVTLNVSLTVLINPTATTAQIASTIQQNIVLYLNTLRIGSLAAVTRIAQKAYLSDPCIENVTNIFLNGLGDDILPPARAVIKAGTVNVTVVTDAG